MTRPSTGLDNSSDSGSFVHLDAFPGNMLAHRGKITAVLDFGVASLCGDPRFDPIASAVYLSTPLITPGSRPDDQLVAASWLENAGLAS